MLDSVDMQLRKGQILTVVGPNGAGKTTLLRMLLGLDTPDSGEIVRHSNVRIGYMPQKFTAPATMPMHVRSLLELYVPRKARGKALSVASELHITHLLSRQVHELSGGELRRVLLARALIADPDVLLLDEPMQGVDVNGQAELYALIEEINQSRGCAVLMVSHDLHIVMAASHEVLCLHHHICCQGTPEDVNRHPEFVDLFGKSLAQHLAIYPHHHDHAHNLQGDVVSHKGCDHG